MINYRTKTSQPRGTSEPDAPAALRNACRIMYAGAVASASHAVVALATTGATKTALEHKHPQWSGHTLSTLTTITVFAIAALALIGVALFIWIARACRRGKNAARIAATVLAAVGVLFGPYDISIGRGTATLIVGFVVTAIGLASVAALWWPSSSAYFRHLKRPQL
jgi:Fe2+ transport system protein B